jgi:hypothetical protein
MTEALTRPVLSEPLTWEQICERYPDQWVVLVEMDRSDGDHNARFRSARVAGAGKTRREPLDQARPLRSAYQSFGHYYTGHIRAPVIRQLIPEPAFAVEPLASLWPPAGSGGESEASTRAPLVSEPLSWSQICERYPEQWVVLVGMEWLSNKGFEFRTARVAGHGKTREQPLDQARPLRSSYSSFCHFFTGTIESSQPQSVL